ncbi:NADH dehydrogenase subunit L [Candidatus Koribacter versatilis Ellin345]|uniref:NADH dehydrogenase subunit L n=1 Tax=Koribacter versatilis (strain Ellin345) TaxID=204669 RepID=Q1IS43_KORVE|nr:NADH-quinone oxidoreductase subunit L [Candidatus Koribacter versatilis]ABF40307.1 NADH dehydrogenase subunit L [Candidatus Koribacter versatilis Ellin345]
MDQNLHLWIIPLLPLAGAAINGLLGKRFPNKLVATIALFFTAASFGYFCYVASQFVHLSQIPHVESYGTWIQVGSFKVEFGAYLDQLTLIMLGVVTGVGFLIHVYSAGYMEHEGGYYRFFAYLNLFMFFMLTLVLGSSYLLMFVGWEGVGLASYLLIGFFFRKHSAAQAGKKAFITNRVGDFGFLIGLFLIIQNWNTLQYTEVFKAASGYGVETHAGLFTAIGICLLIGACGKSAQIPLYVWLPDAMEGPTPVSALIHAATMVTAGVYMVTRSNAIFSRSPHALLLVACIGAATAIFAATIGITQTDIKRVLAYSTISQLGYMFLACGVGAYASGVFHLMTHAFFKALLFLAAGSVIHAVGGEQDMRNMGGLRKYIPWTFWVMTIATFTIAGFPPLAAFFSKDEILWKVWSSESLRPVVGEGFNKFLWAVGLITAGVTSFYMFRQWFMTFFGEYRGAKTEASHGHAPAHGAHDDHGHGEPHESPMIMIAPLVVLAILSFAGGWVGIHNKFDNFLSPVTKLQMANAPSAEESATPHEEHGEEGGDKTELMLMIASVGMAVVGFGAAWYLYKAHPEKPGEMAKAAGGLYTMVLNKYYVDEFYGATIVKPILLFSTSVLWRGIDVAVIDGLLNGSAAGAQETSQGVRRMQSGNIRSYAGWVAVGAAVVIGYMMYVGVGR